jgi:hypothetical protein
MRKTTPIHISRNYQNVLKELNRKTRVPQRYLVESALKLFLKKNHPEHYDMLKEMEQDGDDAYEKVS